MHVLMVTWMTSPPRRSADLLQGPGQKIQFKVFQANIEVFKQAASCGSLNFAFLKRRAFLNSFPSHLVREMIARYA